jgi:CDP-glycerol glycerophosphotransferase (TagB/SpsB family)
LDYPSGQFAATITNKMKDSIQEIEKFITLMKFSDVVINLASTISLDAMLFDTPVVCPAYNPNKNINNEWNNALDWYKSSHFNIIKTKKSVKIVENKEALHYALDQYLNNSELDRTERKSIMDLLSPTQIDTPSEIRIGLKA